MRGQSVFGGVAIAVLLAVVGCSDDVGITVTERFTATLNGTNEKPNAVTTTATGTAEFTYVADSSASNNHPFGRGAAPGARLGTVLRPSCSTNDCGSYFGRRRAMTVWRWDRVCLVGVGVLVACGGGGDGGGTGPCTPGAATQ